MHDNENKWHDRIPGITIPHKVLPYFFVKFVNHLLHILRLVFKKKL